MYRLLTEPESRWLDISLSSFLPVNKNQEAVETHKNAQKKETEGNRLRARKHHLPARVANYNTRFSSFCQVAGLARMTIQVTLH